LINNAFSTGGNKMPFIKGQSGNPGGRPKRDTSLTGLLRKELNRKDGDAPGKTVIVKKLYELAKSGDVIALKYVFDRIDGKPIETVKADLSGAMTLDTAAAAEKLERILLNDN
jgi:hypothetical protein